MDGDGEWLDGVGVVEDKAEFLDPHQGCSTSSSSSSSSSSSLRQIALFCSRRGDILMKEGGGGSRGVRRSP